MKKEVILAIIIGFGIGLLITFGIYTARTALDNAPPDDTASDDVTLTASPSPQASGSLVITNPPQDSLVDTDTVTIEGRASPLAIITIISSESQEIITANDAGRFSAEVEIAGGANQIVISSYTPEGSKSEFILNLVYSSADI